MQGFSEANVVSLEFTSLQSFLIFEKAFCFNLLHWNPLQQILMNITWSSRPLTYCEASVFNEFDGSLETRSNIIVGQIDLLV